MASGLTAEVSVIPINPTIGAEVTGVDLREPVSASMAQRLQAALLDRKGLFFRDQDLDANGFERLSRVFGDPFMHPTMPTLPENPYINPVETSHGPAKDWHVGGPWRTSPFVAELLQLKLTPPTGGDTMWADLQLAYRNLSAPMQQFLDQLGAAYFADPAQYSPTTRQGATERRELVHPLVITHPETGVRGLFYSTSAVRIVGLDHHHEQEAVRAFLLSHASQPRFVVRHRWREGDIAVWDNRAVWHRAVDDYGDAPRVGWHASVTAEWTPS